MKKKSNSSFAYTHVYPRFRYLLSANSKGYNLIMNKKDSFSERQKSSSVLPNSYSVCNTSTIDSEMELKCLEGKFPKDIAGSLYLCQCLGVPEAFMVGDTNIIRIDFNEEKAHLTNKLMLTPAAIARMKLEKTRHRFDYLGLMYLSPGIGLFSYTEGLYLLPDGRISVTSDVDRPWIIDREKLQITTPVGKRNEWLPMATGSIGEIMGSLFAGYSNSHVMYTDTETGENFLVNYQYRAMNKDHPVNLIKWDGYNDFESWIVVDENGENIEIKQSIHELVFTRDYILLADTAFVAGGEFLTPWKNSPLPNKKTVMYIIDRREMKKGIDKVKAKRVEVDEPCIHLIPEYENNNDKLTVYMLHTPATNTAEILKSYDRDLDGNLFSENSIGYGTLPVLDLSSVGKHIIDVENQCVQKSEYISEMPYCWGPYLYSYMGRQVKPFNKQDLFVMFKGFSKDILPKRIFDAYKDVENRKVPLEDMVGGEGLHHNNSICRISTEDFKIADSYIFQDKVLLYTISCLEAEENKNGYVIAGVVLDSDNNVNTSGHEYWIFDGGNLEKGPICKLGHKELNNTTLFHTLYIPKGVEKELNKKVPSYHIDLREDYKREEIEKRDKVLVECFEDIIYPYFDMQDKSMLEKAEGQIKDLITRRIPEHSGKEDIIGEEKITDASAFAERMIEEVERMWKTTGWKVVTNNKDVVVESKPVSGVFESAGVLVTRSVGEIEANAKDIFDILVSPEGYAVIDPFSKKEDHKLPPLEVYDWKEGSRLEAAIARTGTAKNVTEFVVLNVIDQDRLTFVSKSILHHNRPGGSKYSNEGKANNGAERALNTFAIKVEKINENRSRVYCVNYADMSGNTKAWFNNLVNTKLFLQAFYKRISKKMNSSN